MNILSIYFSGTNNTAYFANQIQSRVNKSSQHSITTIDITNDTVDLSSISLEEYDMYIIGGPVYIEVLPHKLTNYIKSAFRIGDNKKVILYFTAAGDTPPALYGLHKHLTKHNYNVIGLINNALCNNFYMSGRYQPTTTDELQTRLLTCNNNIDKVMELLNGNCKSYTPATMNSSRYYTGAFVYKMCQNTYLKKYAYKNFSSSDKCVGCKICVNNCPTSNITIANNQLTFHKNCYGCTRCIHICPKQAILYNGSPISKMNSLPK